MARELTTPALLIKWVGLPVALAALGYFIIGPRFGGEIKTTLAKVENRGAKQAPVASEESSDEQTPASTPAASEEASPAKPTRVASTGPEIEVTARPVKPRRVRKHKPKPAPIVVDPGSDATPVPPVSPDTGDNPAPTGGDGQG